MARKSTPPTEYQLEALRVYDRTGEFADLEVDGPPHLWFHARERVIESLRARGWWTPEGITEAGRSLLARLSVSYLGRPT